MNERWKLESACRDEPKEGFFPKRGASHLRAKLVCASCPVQEECLMYAIANNERFGIWGGRTDKERRPYRREWVNSQAIKRGMAS